VPEPGTVRSVVRRVLAGILAVLAGAVVGLLGAFHHSRDAEVLGVDLPVGLIAGVAALVLTQLLAQALLLRGAGPSLVLFGWLVVVVVLGTSRPEGDLVIPAGTSGEGFLYGGFVVGLVVAFVLAVRSRGASSATEVAPSRR
jgi:hypothetical protein